MAYTNHAFANIKNNSGVTLKSVTLHHQYSDDPDESMTWTDLAPGATASPSLQVGYNTGFIRSGQDYWWVQYTLPDDSKWVSPGTIKETLHSGDEGSTKTFTIKGSILTGFLGHKMQLQLNVLPEYNSWAAIRLHNKFPIPVAAILKHKYSADSDYQYLWGPIAPDAYSPGDQLFIVYFNTGILYPGGDYWTITAYLSIPPYDNAPAAAFKPFSNATADKGCTLTGPDNGEVQTFTLDGTGLTLGIGSGSCSDQWATWNAYNTLAFLAIKNDFTPTISTVTLTHQYSSDSTWRQTRAMIPAGKSSPLMVVEYNTGFLRTGQDYWNVSVYLEDGTWYQNHTSGKECMLESSDAITSSTFSVSSSTFTLALTSGSCTDSMDDKGTFSPLAGRDVNKSYSQNAYIGSHNAFANFADGFWYAQQTGSIPTQLAQGATTLLLDIWYKNGEIYLLHRGIEALQPFAALQKLSDALAVIKAYLELQSRDPVTIVFEDKVDSAYQYLIKDAFVASGTWDLIFNPDTYDVSKNGWPTLTGFFAMKTPLIVLTSNDNSTDFAWQWKYMSENVYGDESLDTVTWLEPRKYSQKLDQLPLCALNHFPTLYVAAFKLTHWLSEAATMNSTSLLKTMIEACKTKWKRYPNYLNADFWEIPADGLIDAIVYLNVKLHGTGAPVLKVENGRAILTEIDHSRLLRGDWDRAARWVDQHFGEICAPLDPERPGPLLHQLTDAINLALVVATVDSVLPPGQSAVRDWTKKSVRELIRYLLDIEPQILRALGAGDGAADLLCAIPYFLMERASAISFEVTEAARSASGSQSAGHDALLLAGLAGHPGVPAQLAAALTATRADTSGRPRMSRLYDLTHEILYLHHVSPETTAEADLVSHLDNLLPGVMAADQDLGAELLACYWIAGGEVGAASRTAARQLKAYSEGQPSDCQVGRDGECRCPKFKEQIHKRLTMVLGLGTTLAIAGEILEYHDEPSGIGTEHQPAQTTLLLTPPNDRTP